MQTSGHHDAALYQTVGSHKISTVSHKECGSKGQTEHQGVEGSFGKHENEDFEIIEKMEKEMSEMQLIDNFDGI